MNKSKKLTAAAAASAVATALVAPAAFAATGMTDIDGSYAKDAIMELVDKGILNGKGDGMFDPTGKIERQDFAIILAKALGLDVSSAPATATFSDVPTTHYAFKYVEAAAKAGLIHGVGNGMFGAGADLSRQDMAVLFVRALGVDATGKGMNLKFSDAGQIADYAKDAVAEAVELGLISGNPDGTFNPAGNAERQAVALVASKFLKVVEMNAKAQLTGATAVDTNTVTLTFSKAVDKLAAADVMVKAKATGAAVNVSTVTLSADMKSATVKTASALASGTTYTVTVGDKTVEFTTAAMTEVSAVTALNLKQVKVEFSGQVDQTAAETVGNYTFTGDSAVAVGTASLQADGKSVIITLGTATTDVFNQQGSYTLATANLKAKDGTAIADASKDFTTFDNTVPTAKEVVVTGPNSLKVTFSAPIKTAAYTDFTLDNGSVSVSNPVTGISNDQYTVTLNVGADLAEGTHTLKVAGSVGYNNLKVAAQTLSFNFAKDTVAPTVSVAAAQLYTSTSSQVTLQFSEPVNLNTASTAKLYAIYNGLNAATTVVPADDAQMVNQNGVLYYDKYVVTFPVVFPTGTVSIFVNNFDDTNDDAKIKDTWGNAFTTTAVSATINVDNVKPTVALVKAASQASVTVDFSETVDPATATNSANYVFMNEDGTVATGTGLDGAGHPTTMPSYDPTTKEVTINGLNLAGGNYKLKVANVMDLAVPAQNTMDTATFSFAVTDTTPPTVTSALYTADQKGLFVYFSKAMDAASITDLNNFEVNGMLLSSLASQATPVTVTATAINGNKGVKFTFSSAWNGLHAAATFNYGHLKDSVGNYTASLLTNLGGGVQADGIVATDISHVKVVAADTITFEVEQPLSGIDLTRFTFQGAPVGQAFYVNQKVTSGADGALVTVKLPVNSANKLYSNVSNFTGLSILAAGLNTTSALLNANGNGLKADVNVSTATDGMPATVTAVSTQNMITGVDGAGFDHGRAIDAVNVTFSEPMMVSTVGLDSFNVAGYTVTDVQPLNQVGNTASQFKVVLTENAWNDLANLPTVTLAKDAKDAAGNVTKANSTMPATVKGF